MGVRLVASNHFRGGMRAAGSHPDHLVVQAFCQCGWTGRRLPWQPGAGDAERAELAAHIAASGHQEFTWGVPAPDGYHGACGHFHDLNDACPVPAHSPQGRLQRITTGSTLTRPDRAADRLAAVAELRAWLDDQQTQAIIGARMAGCTWSDMADAAGVTADEARRRWGPMIGRYEQAGLLDHDPYPTDRPPTRP
jgi:hypothetical protein